MTAVLRMRGEWLAFFLLLGLASGATRAGAQEILRTPQDISTCLCLEQSVNSRQTEMNAQQQNYDAAKSDAEQLKAQADTDRPRLDINDLKAVDAYKQLLDRRDAAQTRFVTEATPSYAAAVERYNDAVRSYNGSCGGKSYDVEALAQARNGLYCPR